MRLDTPYANQYDGVFGTVWRTELLIVYVVMGDFPSALLREPKAPCAERNAVA